VPLHVFASRETHVVFVFLPRDWCYLVLVDSNMDNCVCLVLNAHLHSSVRVGEPQGQNVENKKNDKVGSTEQNYGTHHIKILHINIVD
jgi:hypothetical protein